MSTKGKKVNPIKGKFIGFPRTVELLEEGTYYGRIEDVFLTSDKSQIVIKVAISVDDNKEVFMSRKYDNEAKVTCNSQLWWFLSSFDLISNGEKIIWEKLQAIETVIVEIAHGKYGSYIKTIKPYNEDEAVYVEDEDDSEYAEDDDSEYEEDDSEYEEGDYYDEEDE